MQERIDTISGRQWPVQCCRHQLSFSLFCQCVLLTSYSLLFSSLIASSMAS